MIMKNRNLTKKRNRSVYPKTYSVKGKPAHVLRLTFLKGTFHVRFSVARLCFDCIKTLALANRQRENRSRWSQFLGHRPFLKWDIIP